MPVAAARLAKDDVAGAELLFWLALALVPADARGDDQRLAERMRVPRGAGARVEAHQRAGEAGRIVAAELPEDGDVTGEIVGGGVWVPLRMMVMATKRRAQVTGCQASGSQWGRAVSCRPAGREA